MGLVVMSPATASAAPAILPPPVSVSAADNAITFTVTNPNPRFSFINCTVAILNARDVPDVIRDPAKLLQPGVLAPNRNRTDLVRDPAPMTAPSASDAAHRFDD
ncbi:hypothetical protein ABT116_47870, partial [Streptomyces sp. NPDC002130]|uniref:hypothetical protein n=1 Tax=Streptomyces sp. NPDC002130 TaxID=3155568 RepID=UPI003318AD21